MKSNAIPSKLIAIVLTLMLALLTSYNSLNDLFNSDSSTDTQSVSEPSGNVSESSRVEATPSESVLTQPTTTPTGNVSAEIESTPFASPAPISGTSQKQVILPTVAATQTAPTENSATLSRSPTKSNAGPLSESNFNDFIAQHVTIDGAQASEDDKVYLRKWLQLMGGDTFTKNLLSICQSSGFSFNLMVNNNQGSNYAVTRAGQITFGIKNWREHPESRVPVLIHETTHVVDHYTISNEEPVASLYQKAKSNPWDSYPMTHQREYLASGTEWVLTGQKTEDGSEMKADKLKRIDPEFYDYLVNNFIPKYLYSPL